MKDINNYILEKLKIGKDVNRSSDKLSEGDLLLSVTIEQSRRTPELQISTIKFKETTEEDNGFYRLKGNYTDKPLTHLMHYLFLNSNNMWEYDPAKHTKNNLGLYRVYLTKELAIEFLEEIMEHLSSKDGLYVDGPKYFDGIKDDVKVKLTGIYNNKTKLKELYNLFNEANK